MIKVIEAHYLGDFQIALFFADGNQGTFDGRVLLQRSGSLLEPLRDEKYFLRFFIGVVPIPSLRNMPSIGNRLS